MVQLESNFSEAQKRDTVLSQAVKRCKDEYKEAGKAVRQAENAVTEVEKQLELKNAEIESSQASYKKIQEAQSNAAKSLKDAEENFQAVNAGLLNMTDSGETMTLEGELRAASTNEAGYQTEMKKLEMSLRQKEGQSKDLLQHLKRLGNAPGATEEKRCCDLKEQLQRLKDQKAQLNYTREEEVELRSLFIASSFLSI